jgi:hypothetical protein
VKGEMGDVPQGLFTGKLPHNLLFQIHLLASCILVAHQYVVFPYDPDPEDWQRNRTHFDSNSLVKCDFLLTKL